jgi:hypothetical protein
VNLDGVLNWIQDSLTTYEHNLELQVQRHRYLHNSQITTAPAEPFPACCVVTSYCLVTAFNSGGFLASALKSFLNGGSLSTELLTGYRTELTRLRESQSYVSTDGQSASLSWNKAPMWGLRPYVKYCQTVAGLLLWGALSDERTGLSFA